MDYRFERAALAHIDAHDDSYRITTPQDKPSLEMSIGRTGLIAPIIVKESADNPMVVVSGFRRVEACRQLGLSEVPCRVLPPTTSAARCVEIAIADNLSQRSLNLIEQARCLKLLTGDMLEAPVARPIADALGIPLNNALAVKLNRLAMASQTVQDALVMGIIGLPTALLLSDLSPEDSDRVLFVFERLPMGLNKQREVVLLLKEIAARERVALKHLLRESALKQMLEDDQPDGNLTARRLRSYLRQRRYPRLRAVEDAFDHCVRSMKLGNRMHIMPPPGFEGQTCTLTLRFDNPQDFKTSIRKLSKLADHAALETLFDTVG